MPTKSGDLKVSRQHRASSSSASDELRRYLEKHSLALEEEHPRRTGPPVPTPLREVARRSRYSYEEDLEAATDDLDRAALAVERARRSFPVAGALASERTDHRRQHLELVRDVSLHLESSSLALADAAQLLSRIEQSPAGLGSVPSPEEEEEEEDEEEEDSGEVDILTPEFLASFSRRDEE